VHREIKNLTNNFLNCISKPIIRAAQLSVGEYLRIYTDGKKICCMELEPEPDI
jgi:hypothetical protein